jgi:predicted secreted acid phosphatase
VSCKLAIIDLDKVVADSSERFKMALRADGRTDWKIALNPDNVALDVIVPGAVDALRQLDERGYEIIFLTGRPEKMREATEEWLAIVGAVVIADDKYILRMRPDGDFTKAAEFKKRELAKIIDELKPETLIFVDDLIDDNTDIAHTLLLRLSGASCYSSLAACIAELDKTL